jgi:phosphoribosylglycinamide formyltransferase-1
MSTNYHIRLAVFASGKGSNAQEIINRFKGHQEITVSLIVSNKPEAGVLDIARAEGLDTLVVDRERFLKGDGFVPVLKEKGIDWIILAGFLWKIPLTLIQAYPNRIVNIHPALLPKFGGKGMYGHFVHEAVIKAAETESGITIHFVDEHYDHGQTIFQAACPVEAEDTPDTLAEKIHTLEHRYYPEVIERLIGGA